MLAQINGQITAIKPFSPQGDSKKKPHLILSVLQTTGEDAEILVIKDYDVHHRYDRGQVFESLCSIKDWSYQGKSGLTITVRSDSLIDFESGSNASTPINDPVE